MLLLLKGSKTLNLLQTPHNEHNARTWREDKDIGGAFGATRSLLVLFTGGTFLRWIWWIFCLGETARRSDFLPRHISPTKIRHFGEALFGGEFCTGVQYFALGNIIYRGEGAGLVFGGVDQLTGVVG